MNSIPKIMAIITHNDNMIKDRDELVGLVLEVANDVSKLEVQVSNLKSEIVQLRQHIHELDMKMNKVLQGLESKNERLSVKARAIKTEVDEMERIINPADTLFDQNFGSGSNTSQ
eukprot:NODE_513_length_7367_cov_0.288663.p4 type:complete len:115 gc:universal NODE_513_length_7367_cov_0.288663:359-15(-)